MELKRTAHLVDGSLYVCRAYFAPMPDIAGADGASVVAVHGFTRFLLDLLERAQPTHIAVAFDESLTTSFRNEIYPEYKAHRDPAPPELMAQFALCKDVAAALGVSVLADARYEADDLIGSALMALRMDGFRGVIVSADKDFGQLIGEGDEQWDPQRNQRWDADGVKQRLGVRPEQVADYLALTGDSVDNIPGVPGIGPKTAAILLHHYGTLDALLDRAEEVAFLRMRGAAAASMKLREHTDAARLSRLLSVIALDAPVPLAADAYARRAIDAAAIERLFDHLKFGPLTRARVRALATGAASAA
ncbi:MAG TPA: 5'-3' exonuclease H3TH domain-containing protein [Rhodanobacteraceae bacterium]|nr:5'-3' exonuclease H3TH domain-containing protein [Rhodanobacteraceae bacterium]